MTAATPSTTPEAEPAAGSSRSRYTAVAIFLHWTIALAIIGMIALGWIMGDMDKNDPLRTPLYELHKSIGLTILLLSVARIIWRLMNPPPPEPPMPKLQATVASLVHLAFYVLIIAMPLSGWLVSSIARQGGTEFWGLPWTDVPGTGALSSEARTSLNPVIHNVHSKMAWVIIVMLGLHVAGALKHQIIDRDGLIARMAPGLFGRTDGPVAKGRGALYAFGAAAVLAVATLGAATFLRSSPAAPQVASGGEAPVDAPAKSAAPFWTVDATKSAIAFKGVYMGRPFEGRFKEWTPTIQFDPAKPEDARIRVVVKTSSVSTGEPYFDESVVDVDWFNIGAFPDAVFEVNEGVFKDSETDYLATGVLTMKGVKYPLRLPFTLNIAGETATMHAETSLSRTGLTIGRATATAGSGDTEWVGDEVKLVVDVVAQLQK